MNIKLSGYSSPAVGRYSQNFPYSAFLGKIEFHTQWTVESEAPSQLMYNVVHVHIANFVQNEQFLLSCTGGKSEISPISPILFCSRVWYFMLSTTVLFLYHLGWHPQSSWQLQILSKFWRRNFPVWLRLTRLIRFVESPMQNVSWCRVFLKKVLGKHLWIGRIDAVVNKWIKYVKICKCM